MRSVRADPQHRLDPTPLASRMDSSHASNMVTRHRASRELNSRIHAVPWLYVFMALSVLGCQQSGNQSAFRWPWQTAQAPSQQPAAQVATGRTPEQAELSQLVELMKRENEQSRLSEEQRGRLARLTELAKSQAQRETQTLQDRQQQQLQKLQEQTDQLAQQRQELRNLGDLRRKSLELDANNRDLHSQLARSQQQTRLFEDQLKLTRQQLQETTEQLSGAMESKLASDNRASALNASLQRRGSANISANRSAQQKLAPVTIAGLEVRQDGDVIRIELPSHQLFESYSATLTSGATQLIDQVAGSVAAEYSQQKIGVEAHTDNAQLQGEAWRSNHQLSAAQAMAVFEQLVQRHGFSSQQLFVLGHGPNYPIVSNATPAGQQRNRRVELVIYPETAGAR